MPGLHFLVCRQLPAPPWQPGMPAPTMNNRVDRLLRTSPAMVAAAKRSGGGGSKMPAGRSDKHEIHSLKGDGASQAAWGMACSKP